MKYGLDFLGRAWHTEAGEKEQVTFGIVGNKVCSESRKTRRLCGVDKV
jgi:hypothetical protein